MDYKIAVLAGDGIGPEIIEQAIKVLKAIGKKYNHNFQFTEALVGATAIDKVGDPFPEETLLGKQQSLQPLLRLSRAMCLADQAILPPAIW